MRERGLGRPRLQHLLAVFALGLAGCPAFLQDNFEIVDASDDNVPPADAGSHLDATSPADAMSASDAAVPTDSTSPSDVSDDGPNGDTEAPEAGCAQGQIECADACVDPSSAANCGACDNTCGGDAALCAESEDGSFGCAATCPTNVPLSCGTTCVDPTSDPNNCGGCDAPCATSIANSQPTCTNSTCGFACDTNYSLCAGACVDYQTDSNNCGGCGSTYACANGSPCVTGVCQESTEDAGTDAETGEVDSGSVPCPAGGCPRSTVSGYTSCPFGACNGSPTCTAGGVCVCTADSQCLSGKCVEVHGQNDQGCGSSGCTGTGARDGFDCELASPGIPVPTGTTYSCPANAGYQNSQLTCQASHTNCYCTSDSECPSGHCVPNAANNDNCSGCTGTGTPDYRGCEATTTIPSCPIYIGCPNNTTCSYPTCYCTSDVACASGHCIPSGNNGNCSGCTGTGTSDGHGCQPPPSSIACTTSGGTACTTTLTPTPVLNSASTACLCVADSDCSSGKCVNSNSQCSPSSGCTGTGTADSEDCETATSTPNAWSCSAGNCDTVSSPSGTCTASGVPCWCTSNSQCGSGALCSSWNGCASGACTGTGDGNAFHCVY